MRDPLRRLMYRTKNDILQFADYARDMAGAACWCERDGQHGLADEMRCVGREYGVRGLEMRSRLALLEHRLVQCGDRKASGHITDG